MDAISKRMKQLGAHFCVYVALYVTSIVINQIVITYDPRGLYLLGWTTHNLYWFVWVPSLVFALCGADYWAWTITIGNLIGVVVGQVLGEYLAQINFFGDLSMSGFHPSFRIWIVCVIGSLLLGAAIQLYFFLNSRKKGNG